ncbi:MAG: DNA replication protein DnaC, partial [Lachnospiraceae bacterium]|nr:DNA replication protein DnaC [Lachnospiraceae bacterium]
MATLTREQYDSIMFRYGQRRRARLSEIESRRRRIYASIPEYQRLDESVPTKAMDALRARLSGGSEKDCRGEISEISAKKRSLLRMHGFPEDYLEVPFTCPLC